MGDEVNLEGGFLLEPANNRVFDFSVQYLIEDGELRHLEIIAPSGRYRGSLSFPKFCGGMDPELARFVMEKAFPIYQPGSPFSTALLDWARSLHFEGPLGVDAYTSKIQTVV